MHGKTLILSLILLMITPCLIFSQVEGEETPSDSNIYSESKGEMGVENVREKVTVIFTEDLQALFRGSIEGRFGLADVSAVTGYARQRSNVLFLDAGGTTDVDTVFFAEYPRLYARILEEIGYDALAPGFSELKKGLGPLLELEESNSLPILCSNLTADGTAPFRAHYVFNVGGLRVGVFGLTTPGIENQIEEEGPLATFNIGDPLAATEESVDELEAAGVDVLIALTHLGLSDLYEQGYFSESDLKRAEQRLSGRVDLVIDGGGSHSYARSFNFGRAVISGTGGSGSIGGVEIVVEAGEVIDVAARMIDAEDVAKAGLDPMPEVVSLIESLSVAMESKEEEPETVQKPKEEEPETVQKSKEEEPETVQKPKEESTEKPELGRKPESDQKSELDKKDETGFEDVSFTMPEIELFFYTGPNFYTGATGYSLSFGAMSDLEEILDLDSPIGDLVLGLLFRNDGLRMAEENLSLSSVGTAFFAGYRFDPADYVSDIAFLQNMRVIPRLTFGGMSLNVSKEDRSAYSGFSGYLSPGVLVDKKLPLEIDLRAGLVAEYNMTFGDAVWRSLHLGAFVSWVY